VEILLLTAAPAGQVALPALDLLPHSVRTAPRDVRMLVAGPSPEVVLVDARTELADARATCRMLRATGLGMPLMAVLTESGLVAVHADWGVDDVLLASAGPAEVEARLRLAVGRLTQATAGSAGGLIKAGELTIDPDTYAARLKGRPLDLTYKEFEPPAGGGRDAGAGGGVRAVDRDRGAGRGPRQRAGTGRPAR